MTNPVQAHHSAEIIQFPTTKETTVKKKQVQQEPPHEAVEPIKNLEDIQLAKEYFLSKGPEPVAYRNYMMFVININNAVRISDLLSLRIKDVAGIDRNGRLMILDQAYIRESKTGKTRYIFFGPSSKAAIEQYLASIQERDGGIDFEDYLFAGTRRTKDGESKPITRQYAWNLISTMGHMISKDRDKQLHLGTHSMRKTFGYQKIKQNPEDPMIVAKISEMYNHSSMSTTYRYLGIDTEEKRNLCTTNEL